MHSRKVSTRTDFATVRHAGKNCGGGNVPHVSRKDRITHHIECRHNTILPEAMAGEVEANHCRQGRTARTAIAAFLVVASKLVRPLLKTAFFCQSAAVG
jgi:hypothetical protein